LTRPFLSGITFQERTYTLARIVAVPRKKTEMIRDFVTVVRLQSSSYRLRFFDLAISH
jgi:hypothetical protein